VAQVACSFSSLSSKTMGIEDEDEDEDDHTKGRPTFERETPQPDAVRQKRIANKASPGKKMWYSYPSQQEQRHGRNT
jgi:hypothetical protein